tara:strand:+ start:97 stop:288 length:192 start_codon:yes stop_codon:yes gene_type:complete
MEELKIHSDGQKDYLKELTEKYAKLKNILKQNPKLSEKEKQIELKSINKEFVREKKDSNQKLY